MVKPYYLCSTTIRYTGSTCRLALSGQVKWWEACPALALAGTTLKSGLLKINLRMGFLPGCTLQYETADQVYSALVLAQGFQMGPLWSHKAIGKDRRASTFPQSKGLPVCECWGSLPEPYSQSMLFCSARIHCWYKDIMVGRKADFAPE